MSSTQYEQSDKGKESTSKSIILGEKNLFLQNFTPRQEDFHSQKLSSAFKIIATQGVYQLLPTRKENMFTPKKLSCPETFFHNLVFKEHTNGIQRAYQQSGIQRAYQQGSRTCFQETFVPSPAFLLFSFPSTKLPFFCSTSGGGP